MFKIDNKTKIICFDVDGTLVENKSSWVFLTLNLGCSVEKIAEIYQRTENGTISFNKGVSIVEELFRQSGKASKEHIEAIFRRVYLKREANDLISYLKERGYLIYLISGGIDLYVGIIAQKAGADGFFGHASLEFDDQGNLSKIKYGKSQGKAKLKRIEELSKKFSVPADKMIFVGDSENDYEAFIATKHGIAMRPYAEKLEKVAWKKIDSLLEIKDLIG